MRYLLLIIGFFFLYSVHAQDKLFFSDGTIQQGIILSVAKDALFFKLNDSSAVQRIDKVKLVMAEKENGIRYLFGVTAGRKNTDTTKAYCKRNFLGLQPLNLFTGRLTFFYEHFSKDDRIGFMIPLSLTFDPLPAYSSLSLDTSTSSTKTTYVRGVNFIGGLDVNFYMGKRQRIKFFMGPRLRYGTDLLLQGIEAYSVQTQVGWRMGDCQKKFGQKMSVGFGFARILSSALSRAVTSKQTYPWISLNYQLGIRW